MSKVACVFCIIVAGTATAGGLFRPHWTLYRGDWKDDLRHNLANLCLATHSSCVGDLTSTKACRFDQPKVLPNNPDISSGLATLIQACPMYKWRKAGGIYIVEPRNKSDSYLGVLVGPLTVRMNGASLLSELLKQSHLPVSVPKPVASALEVASNQTGPPRQAQFILPRDTFKKNLIRAAKQLPFSSWTVERRTDGYFDAVAYDCAAPELLEKNPR